MRVAPMFMFSLAFLVLQGAVCAPVAAQKQPEGSASKGNSPVAEEKATDQHNGGFVLREVIYSVGRTDEGVQVRVTSPSYRSTINIKGSIEGSVKAAHPAFVVSKRLIEVLAVTNVDLEGPVDVVIKKYIATEMSHFEKVAGAAIPVRSEIWRMPSGRVSVLWEIEMPVRAAEPNVVPIRWRVFLSTVSGDHIVGISTALVATDDKQSAIEVLKASLTTLKTEPLNSKEVLSSLPANCGRLVDLASMDVANRLVHACKRKVPFGCLCLSTIYLTRQDADSVQLAGDALSLGCENDEASSCGALARLIADNATANQFREKACRLGDQPSCEKSRK